MGLIRDAAGEATPDWYDEERGSQNISRIFAQVAGS